MIKIRRTFFFSGLIAFIIIAVALAVFVRQMVRSNLVEIAESKNVALTQAFSNSLWPAFAPLVEDSTSLSPEELQQDPRIPQLFDLVTTQLTGLSIVKIKVYNLAGLTVFSTELAQIGDNKLDNSGYLAASQGEVASELTHRDTFSAFEQTIEDRDVFSSYVPIYEGGQIVGVFEVYDDVTALVVRTNQVQWLVMVGVVLLLAVLFIFLTVVGQRTFDIAQKQYEAVRRSEQSSRESEQKYSNLFHQSGDGIFLLDWHGRIQDVNTRIEQMLGYTRQELLAMTLDKLHPTDSQAQMKQRTAQLLEQGLAQFEIEFLTKEGDLLPAEVSVTMFELQGEQVLQGIVRDIRERKRQEQALLQARDEALAASRMKTQLLANVSHELRTPLNAILGYSEMLQAGVYGDISTRQHEAAAQIIDSVGHLLNFVNNMLDQAHIEAGKLQLNPQPVALLDLVLEVEELVKVLADAKGLTLRSAISPEMPTQIYADRYWLRQILTNLLGNSIKFTNEGTVDVKIFPSGADNWVIQVADTGIGIPESAREKIFEPFWQLSSSKQKLGSGLGLSIVKQLTTMMGGHVQLHSSEGKGTTFVVTLPLAPVPEFVG